MASAIIGCYLVAFERTLKCYYAATTVLPYYRDVRNRMVASSSAVASGAYRLHGLYPLMHPITTRLPTYLYVTHTLYTHASCISAYRRVRGEDEVREAEALYHRSAGQSAKEAEVIGTGTVLGTKVHRAPRVCGCAQQAKCISAQRRYGPWALTTFVDWDLALFM